MRKEEGHPFAARKILRLVFLVFQVPHLAMAFFAEMRIGTSVQIHK
jgi:hypothetical protein